MPPNEAQASVFSGLGPFGAFLRGGQFMRLDGPARDRFAKRWMHDNAPDEVRNDAGLSMAFARQLEYVIKKVYEADYPEFRATEFIPVNTEIPPGALTYTYRRIDLGAGGNAKIINSYSEDLPKVDVNAKEQQAPIVTLGISYEWSVQDLASAAFSGIPIEAYKARAARRAIDYLLERIACIGDANSGIAGMMNAPGLTATARTAASISAGTWAYQLANVGSLTTPVVVGNIIADINLMIQGVFTATKSTFRPTNLLVPFAVYMLLETTPRSISYTTDNVLSYLESMTGLDIDYWPSLDQYTPGQGIAYVKDPDLLELMISQPFTQMPPQPKNLAWEVPCMERTGGVQLRSPPTATTMSGMA